MGHARYPNYKYGRIHICPQRSQSAHGVIPNHTYGRKFILLALYDMDAISLLNWIAVWHAISQLCLRILLMFYDIRGTYWRHICYTINLTYRICFLIIAEVIESRTHFGLWCQRVPLHIRSLCNSLWNLCFHLWKLLLIDRLEDFQRNKIPRILVSAFHLMWVRKLQISSGNNWDRICRRELASDNFI